MESAGKYVVPSQMFVDPEITPEALYKAARALNRAGQKEKAEDLLQQLEKRYPTYKPTVAQ
jgi:TolA-binding protein